eukprot:jgi/Mesvir1/26951/Mv20671-RA.1
MTMYGLHRSQLLGMSWLLLTFLVSASAPAQGQAEDLSRRHYARHLLRARRPTAKTQESWVAEQKHFRAGDAVSKRLWPPGCKMWSLDPKTLTLRDQDGARSIPLWSHMSRPMFDEDDVMAFHGQWDAVALGMYGLLLGDTWALDFWVYTDHQLARHHYFLTSYREHAESFNGETWRPTYSLGAAHGTGMLHAFRWRTNTLGSTGLSVVSLERHQWHRVTVVKSPSDSTTARLYVNGTEKGKTNVLNMDRVSVIGNGGRSMEFPGGNMYDVRLCVTKPPDAQAAAEAKLKDHVWAHTVQLLAEAERWLVPLKGSIILVGNSAKLLSGGEATGKLIDRHNVVFRFNALSTSTYKSAVGSKVTHDVLGDLTQLCGCHEGHCCEDSHMDKMMDRYRKQPVMLLFARGGRTPPAFLRAADKSGGRLTVMRMKTPKHLEDVFNMWLDAEAKTHPQLVHRIPPIYAFRTGFRIIALMLMHGLRPSVIGFDLEEEANALYTGRRKHTGWDQDTRYLPETRVLSELIQAGALLSWAFATGAPVMNGWKTGH